MAPKTQFADAEVRAEAQAAAGVFGKYPEVRCHAATTLYRFLPGALESQPFAAIFSRSSTNARMTHSGSLRADFNAPGNGAVSPKDVRNLQCAMFRESPWAVLPVLTSAKL